GGRQAAAAGQYRVGERARGVRRPDTRDRGRALLGTGRHRHGVRLPRAPASLRRPHHARRGHAAGGREPSAMSAVRRLAAPAAVLACTLAWGAPPAAIDLDRFDSLKQHVDLPNGETLAYVPLGDPKGAPVVLIHGYTDNARDWVPLAPYLAPG